MQPAPTEPGTGRSPEAGGERAVIPVRERVEALLRQGQVWMVALAALVLVILGVMQESLPTLSAPGWASTHAVVELVGVLLLFSVFAVHWHAAADPRLRDARAVFVGAAFLAVAAFDVLHLLAGADPVVSSRGVEHLATGYWLAGRAMFAAALLAAAGVAPHAQSTFLRRLFLLIGLAVVVLGGVSLVQLLPPDALVVGGRLALGGALAEAAVIALVVVATVAWSRRYRRSGDRLQLTVAAALALAGLAEVCFALYARPRGPMGLLAHVYKLTGYYLAFEAFFAGSILRPWRLLSLRAERLSDTSTGLAGRTERLERALAASGGRQRASGQERDEARARADRLAARAAAATGIGEAALLRPDPAEAVDEVLRRLARALEAPRVVLRRPSADGRWWLVETEWGGTGEAAPVPAASGETTRAGPPGGVTGLEDGTRAVLLRVDGQVLGRLDVVPAEGAGPPAPEDRALLEVTAHLLASLLARTRLQTELEGLLAAAPAATLVLGPRGEVLRANLAARRLLGLEETGPALPLSDRLAELRPLDREGQPVAPVDTAPFRALEGRTALGDTLVLHPKPGRAVWLRVDAVPLRRAGGRVEGALASLADVTGLHELEAQREELMRMVSHDLRTPLSAIHLQAQRLLRTAARDGGDEADEDGDLLRGLTAIRRTAERMGTMIRDLVDSERYAAGRLELSLMPLDLRAHLTELLDHDAGQLDTGRVDVLVPDGLPPVLGDPARLDRILEALLSNALRHSPAASRVRVSAERCAEGLRVSVADDGDGIEAEELPRIFERYYRTGAALRSEGLGLGLYVSRLLIEAHGGRIQVQSAPGVGSTFSFSLPLARPDEAGEEPGAEAAPRDEAAF